MCPGLNCERDGVAGPYLDVAVIGHRESVDHPIDGPVHNRAIDLDLIEGGSEEDIKRQLLQSLDAFFDFYPEV